MLRDIDSPSEGERHGNDGPAEHREIGEDGISAIQGKETLDSPRNFGVFAHSAYCDTAYDRFEDVELEESVRVASDDGGIALGRVDLIVDENKLFDFKTNDMRDWTAVEATRHGDQHGRQMRGYMDSPDTPQDSSGWLVATVPPESSDSRDAYAGAASKHNVGVVFSTSEQPGDVIDGVERIVRSPTSRD